MGMILRGPLSGGAAPPAGPSISLRDAGAFYRSDVDGFNTNIPLASRVADDNLFVIVAGPVSSDATQTGWTRTHAYGSNRLQVFTRVATGDANDNFLIPAEAGGGARIAQMASFQYSGFVGAPPNFLQNVQSGFLTDGAAGGDSSWDYLGMSDANLYTDTLVLHWALKFRAPIASASLSLTPPYPGAADNEIGSFADYVNESSSQCRLWFTWGWEFQPTDEAMGSGVITYSPLEGFGVETLQHTRWEFN